MAHAEPPDGISKVPKSFVRVDAGLAKSLAMSEWGVDPDGISLVPKSFVRVDAADIMVPLREVSEWRVVDEGESFKVRRLREVSEWRVVDEGESFKVRRLREVSEWRVADKGESFKVRRLSGSFVDKFSVSSPTTVPISASESLTLSAMLKSLLLMAVISEVVGMDLDM